MQPWAESKQSAAILLEDGSFIIIIYAWSAKALLKFHDLSHVIGVGCFNIIKCVMPREHIRVFVIDSSLGLCGFVLAQEVELQCPYPEALEKQRDRRKSEKCLS